MPAYRSLRREPVSAIPILTRMETKKKGARSSTMPRHAASASARLDCLIVHRDRLGDLPYLCGKLSGSNVIIYADEPAFAALSGHYPTALLQPATADSFGTEFLDYKMRSVQSPPWMKPCNISPATARNTAKASSVNRQKPSAVSSKWSMPPASTPMYLRLSPTGHSSVSERKSVSAHRSYMPAARWRCLN